MNPKRRLIHLLERLTDIVLARAESLAPQRNVELFLAAILERTPTVTEFQDPAAYVGFLRSCFERMVMPVTEIKTTPGTTDLSSKRFTTVVAYLAEGAAPIDVQTAQRLAGIADRLAGLRQPLEWERWASDMGANSQRASSLGRKGRLVWNIIRFSRSERALELGTAYGMSAQFILEAMKTTGLPGRLTTVEGWAPMFSIASEALKPYGDVVSCHFGMTRDVLPRLIESPDRFDFLFHDAGHSRDDFISDFSAVEPALLPGAVVLFDDIRFDDWRFSSGPARTYEGWLEVVRHPRVRRAVEIDGGRMGRLGLLSLA